jgi:RNA polymerase sigma factor (sigma-70 family)
MAIERRSLEEINSEEFVARLKTLDMEIFDIFFESVFPNLVRYLVYTYEQLGEGEIEELASDALKKVHKDLPNFDYNGGAKLTTWVFKIARNTTIDRLRQHAVMDAKAEIVLSDTKAGAAAVTAQLVGDWSRGETPSVSATDPVDANEDAMLRALKSLSESDQDILRLRACMDYDEICRVENRDEGALRTRHSRALQRLKDAYEKELQNGGE